MKLLTIYPYHNFSFFLGKFNQLHNEVSDYIQKTMRIKIKADLSSNIEETIQMYMENNETSKN